MSHSILIAGCGYVGTSLAREFQKRGDEVFALRRSTSALADLLGAGIQTVQADLTKPETLKNIPETDWVVICVAPGRPPGTAAPSARPALDQAAPDENSAEAYRKTYVESVWNLMKVLTSVGAGFPRPYTSGRGYRAPTSPRILYISSTSVYGQTDGEWVDENSPTEPEHETGKILLEAEKQILQSGFSAIVLRLGGIYGPGRNRIAFLKENPHALSQPDDYINLIHVADIVSASVLLLEKGKPGDVYLGVDDEPVRRREYFSEIANLIGAPAPTFKSDQTDSFLMGRTNKRGRNQKLKSLGFKFKYPTFREGYRELIERIA